MGAAFRRFVCALPNAKRTALALVMKACLCFSGANSNLPERYDLASICLDFRCTFERRRPRRLQFDERSRAARVEARDPRFVGAACVGYIELSATHDSVRADEARSRDDRIAGRIERVARDAHAFGVWIDREGAAVVERRWRCAGAGTALRYRALYDLTLSLRFIEAERRIEAETRSPKAKPRSLTTCGVSVFWRRGWDSNPRYGKTVRLISSQVHSTTLPPLRLPFRVFVNWSLLNEERKYIEPFRAFQAPF